MLADNKISYTGSPVISLEAVSPRTTVVKALNKYFKANIGEYRLIGSPQILNILLRNGIGSRRGQGFGMFYIVNKSPQGQDK